MKHRARRIALVILLAMVLPFALLEAWARSGLFNRASYTNSVTFDRTWRALTTDSTWNVMMLGTSEVRWGFSTEAMDAAFAENGLFAHSLNFGIDGLGLSHSLLFLPRLNIEQRLPELKVAIIGVQLTDAYPPTSALTNAGLQCDSDLLGPIFTSPWARDNDVAPLCREGAKPTAPFMMRVLENHSAVIRNRAQVRAALLPMPGLGPKLIELDSSALAMAGTGYHPHVPIRVARENYEQGLAGLRREKLTDSAAYSPMPPDLWPMLVGPRDFFDQWAGFFEGRDVLPVFVALPTNPQRIDIANRRADYLRNSALLHDWATRTGRVYIDLGLSPYDDLELNYADHRHLSFVGAARYSRRLAEALAAEPRVRAALAVRDIDLLTGRPVLPVQVFVAGRKGVFDSNKQSAARPVPARGLEPAAVLLTSSSTSLPASGDGDTTKISLPAAFTRLTAAKDVIVTIRARAPARRGSPEMRVMYSRPGVGADGWKSVRLSREWRDYRLAFHAPDAVEGASSNDLIGIWADSSGKNLGVEVSRITLDIQPAPAGSAELKLIP